MRRPVVLLMGLCMLAPAVRAQSRGELLYTTHCIACHSTQIHWREQRRASDWGRLQTQVRQWQGAASLAWSDSDILEVARYLNDTIYKFKVTAEPASTSGLRAGPAVQARHLTAPRVGADAGRTEARSDASLAVFRRMPLAPG